MDFRGKKTLPKKDEYEDEGTWIWLSMACESRLLSHQRSKEAGIDPSEFLMMNWEKCPYMEKVFKIGGRFYSAIIGQFCAAIDTRVSPCLGAWAFQVSFLWLV
jgi:hypothetical protein